MQCMLSLWFVFACSMRLIYQVNFTAPQQGIYAPVMRAHSLGAVLEAFDGVLNYILCTQVMAQDRWSRSLWCVSQRNRISYPIS